MRRVWGIEECMAGGDHNGATPGTKEALVERYREEWLGGEGHVNFDDPRSAVERLLQRRSARRAILMVFGFASGLLTGIGLTLLLSRRQA